MIQNNIRKVLGKHKVIPVVSFDHVNDVEATINLLISKGINCIEITLRNEFAFDCIKAAKLLNKPDFHVGIGTVVSVAQIERATALNVDFMVSPGINAGLAPAFEKSGIAFIPGVATPSEIILGKQLGWNTFKFFPANLFGGIKALKTYSNVFPDIQFCPTGGISEETHQDYLELPNVISVGGSWLI
jgi:2-dehydro-3-deoxyphosphogluconate aldolase/(4S)-4-hydroxy-2-oxoglutarate aldolase|tara:strand:+ start:6381 stop:6941 length:561 start_codon:yes stop_codon:yes gene_type:complete